MQKVVIIEDNQLNMKLFHDLLSLMSCEIFYTITGVGAVDLVRQHIPDLILMDIQLDGISGLDLIEEIKGDHMLSHIPIIVVSAYAMPYEEQKIRQSGCDYYLSKPVSIDEFFTVVQKYIHHVPEIA